MHQTLKRTGRIITFALVFLIGIVIAVTHGPVRAKADVVHNRPFTTASLSPSPTSPLAGLSLYNDPVTVTLTATADTGYAIGATYYSLDGGALQTYTAPFTVSGTGKHGFSYWSVDNSGIEELDHKSMGFTIGYRHGVINSIEQVGINIGVSAHFDDFQTYLNQIIWGADCYLDFGSFELYNADTGALVLAQPNSNSHCGNAGDGNTWLAFPPLLLPPGTYWIHYSGGSYDWITDPFVYAPTPTTTLTLAGQNGDGTYPDPTSATLSTTAAVGTTIAHTYYKLDGGGQQTYVAPITISNSGAHQVEYWSVDNGGITEVHHTQSFTIHANLTPPTNLVANSPTKQPNLSWDGVVAAMGYAIYRDGLVIASTTTPSYSDTLASEGTHSYYVTATGAGNAESAASNSVNVLVDKTAPTVSMPTWSANPLQQGQNTTLSTTVSETASGIASVQYSVNGGTSQPMTFDAASGTWRATFGSNLLANTFDVTITATDNAGNISAGTTDILAVYTTANGYVTGHAKMYPSAGDVLPIALDTSNNPANLVLGFANVTSPASGSFDMDYAVKKNQDEFSISATSVSWVVVADSTHASILGHGDLTKYVNGVKTIVQNVTVRFDIVLGAKGTPDQITIKIFNPGLNPNVDPPTYIMNDADSVNGSNLMIHP